jgi:hypothetical protein
MSRLPVLHALKQLRGPFRSTTYFGDGIWDQECAARLGWEFVAVGPKLGDIENFASVPPDHPLQR